MVKQKANTHYSSLTKNTKIVYCIHQPCSISIPGRQYLVQEHPYSAVLGQWGDEMLP